MASFADPLFPTISKVCAMNRFVRHSKPFNLFRRRSSWAIWIVSIATVFHLTRSMQEAEQHPRRLHGWLVGLGLSLYLHRFVDWVLPPTWSLFIICHQNQIHYLWSDSEVSEEGEQQQQQGILIIQFWHRSNPTAPVLNEWQMNKLLLLLLLLLLLDRSWLVV